ncbi:MAG: cytidine deaminase [Kiritimatiellales bacterium]|nr:cytidine deaminase [Kiritimatiellales bacterium]
MNPIDLVKAAAEAAQKAYAPYSKFKVGAALLCADGTVFTGCNVENASYGLTNCAERTAVFSAVAAGNLEFEAIAIVAGGDAMPYPCGACRQVLAEFCDPHLTVHIASAGNPGVYETIRLGELLPHSFKL